MCQHDSADSFVLSFREELGHSSEDDSVERQNLVAPGYLPYLMLIAALERCPYLRSKESCDSGEYHSELWVMMPGLGILVAGGIAVVVLAFH